MGFCEIQTPKNQGHEAVMKKFPTEDEQLVLPVGHHWQSRHYKPNIHPQLVERWCIFRAEVFCGCFLGFFLEFFLTQTLHY